MLKSGLTSEEVWLTSELVLAETGDPVLSLFLLFISKERSHREFVERSSAGPPGWEQALDWMVLDPWSLLDPWALVLGPHGTGC